MTKDKDCCNCEYEDICRNKSYAGCRIRSKAFDKVEKLINYGGYGGIVVFSSQRPPIKDEGLETMASRQPLTTPSEPKR